MIYKMGNMKLHMCMMTSRHGTAFPIAEPFVGRIIFINTEFRVISVGSADEESGCRWNGIPWRYLVKLTYVI